MGKLRSLVTAAVMLSVAATLSATSAFANRAVSNQGAPNYNRRPSITDPATAKELRKFRSLGALYTKRFVSDVIFYAATDQNKIRSSQKLMKAFVDDNTVSDCGRHTEFVTSYDELKNSAELDVRFSPFTCRVNDIERLYFSLVRDEYLSYFPLRTKIGTWWAYLDTSSMDTWEIYFWMAFFVDQGATPEYSPEIGVLVLTNFMAMDGAVAFRDAHPESPIKVAYVVYQETPTSLNADTTVYDELSRERYDVTKKTPSAEEVLEDDIFRLLPVETDR